MGKIQLEKIRICNHIPGNWRTKSNVHRRSGLHMSTNAYQLLYDIVWSIRWVITKNPGRYRPGFTVNNVILSGKIFLPFCNIYLLDSKSNRKRCRLLEAWTISGFRSSTNTLGSYWYGWDRYINSFSLEPRWETNLNWICAAKDILFWDLWYSLISYKNIHLFQFSNTFYFPNPSPHL